MFLALAVMHSHRLSHLKMFWGGFRRCTWSQRLPISAGFTARRSSDLTVIPALFLRGILWSPRLTSLVSFSGLGSCRCLRVSCAILTCQSGRCLPSLEMRGELQRAVQDRFALNDNAPHFSIGELSSLHDKVDSSERKLDTVAGYLSRSIVQPAVSVSGNGEASSDEDLTSRFPVEIQTKRLDEDNGAEADSLTATAGDTNRNAVRADASQDVHWSLPRAEDKPGIHLQ